MHLIQQFFEKSRENRVYYINCRSEIFPFFKIRKEEKSQWNILQILSFINHIKKMSNNYLVKPRRCIYKYNIWGK